MMAGDLKEVENLIEIAWKMGWTSVNLSHHNLTVLPSSICKLGNLKILLLNNNRIIMPPGELVFVDKLRGVVVRP